MMAKTYFLLATTQNLNTEKWQSGISLPCHPNGDNNGMQILQTPLLPPGGGFLQQSIGGGGCRNPQQHADGAAQITANCNSSQYPYSRRIDFRAHNFRVNHVSFDLLENQQKDDEYKRFEGVDGLYLCFTSGMSGTIQSARLCLNELKEKYPDRTILCVDTLCASLGEGVLVQEAARRQTEGVSILELQNWVVEHRQQVCHWFTVDVFDHLKHSGRVSSAAAVVGTALQIKPLLHVDQEGKLAVAEKPRGRKQAINADRKSVV